MKLLEELKETEHYKKVMETVSEKEQEGIAKIMEEFLAPWQEQLDEIEKKIKEDPEFSNSLAKEMSKLYSQKIDINNGKRR